MPAGCADELRRRLNENCTLTKDDLVEKMHIDIPLPVGYISEEFVEELERLEPYGVANPRPLFAQKDVPVRSMALLGKNRNVLKIVLEGRDATGSVKTLDAVCFDDAADTYERIKDRDSLSVLYQPGFNEYNGHRSIQLTIKDLM